MAILQVNDIYMGFSGETLFKDINFSVDEKDKIGIIGVNGAGKTTFTKGLAKEGYKFLAPLSYRYFLCTDGKAVAVTY